jgi:hypothetical protein
MTPDGVIRPICSPSSSVNQRFPSGPSAIPHGSLPAVGMLNSVTTPDGVIRPIVFAVVSVNHRLPSGPLVIPNGLPPLGIGNWVTVP